MVTGDYDYIREFFKDNPDELDRFMRQFDGIRLMVELSSHKRFQAQVMLLRGSHPNDVCRELDMIKSTVWSIKQRMQKNLMYMVKETV